MKKLVATLALALTLTACGSSGPAPSESVTHGSASSSPTTGVTPMPVPNSNTKSSTPDHMPTLSDDNLPRGASTVGIDQCDKQLFSQEDARAEISQGWDEVMSSVGQSNHLDLINGFYDDVKAFDLASQPGCRGDLDLSFFRVSIANLKADVREGWDTTETYPKAEKEYQALMEVWQ